MSVVCNVNYFSMVWLFWIVECMTCGFGNDIDFVFVDFQIICGFYELNGEIGFDFIIAKAHYSHSQNTYSSLKFQQ